MHYYNLNTPNPKSLDGNKKKKLKLPTVFRKNMTRMFTISYNLVIFFLIVNIFEVTFSSCLSFYISRRGGCYKTFREFSNFKTIFLIRNTKPVHVFSYHVLTSSKIKIESFLRVAPWFLGGLVQTDRS